MKQKNAVELQESLSKLIEVYGNCPILMEEYGSYDEIPITSINAIKQEKIPEGATSRFEVGTVYFLLECE